VDENGEPTKVYSWDYRRPFDGSWFRVLSAAFPWVDGRLAHVVSSIDITDNKNNEAEAMTVRALYIIGPDHKLRLSMLYPASTGRNVE
jgi:alkyl hydroperoxide reductase subunit AhpC